MKSDPEMKYSVANISNAQNDIQINPAELTKAKTNLKAQLSQKRKKRKCLYFIFYV